VRRSFDIDIGQNRIRTILNSDRGDIAVQHLNILKLRRATVDNDGCAKPVGIAWVVGIAGVLDFHILKN